MDLAHYVPSRIGDEAFAQRLATYFRRAASPGAAVALLRMNTQIDIRQVLPTIRVPTLVIHRMDDRAGQMWRRGDGWRGEIPGARFVELQGDDHYAVGSVDQDAILDEIQEFLTGWCDHCRSLIVYSPRCSSPILSAPPSGPPVSVDRCLAEELLDRHHYLGSVS